MPDHETTQSPIERARARVAASPCSAYDCEFVALAADLTVPLVTTDKKLVKSFPDIAIHIDHFEA